MSAGGAIRVEEGTTLRSVDEIFDEIVAGDAVQGVEQMPPQAALGRILAEDVFSPMDLPPFDNAAMDGYGAAVDAIGLEAPFSRRLARPRYAGSRDDAPLKAGEAVRLLTGAPIPPGVESVLFQERCRVSSGRVTFFETLRPGRNIRRRGEDLRAGELAVARGVPLDPRRLALMSALGLEAATVRRRVRVGFLSIGDELAAPGEHLSNGRIFDANRPMLAGLLDVPFIELTDLGIARDEGESVSDRLRQGMELDVVVTSGGVAGSERDRLLQSVRALGGVVHSHRLAMNRASPWRQGASAVRS